MAATKRRARILTLGRTLCGLGVAGREGSENLVIAEKRGECGAVNYAGVSRRLEFRGFKPDIHARGRGRLFMVVSAAHVVRRSQLTNA